MQVKTGSTRRSLTNISVSGGFWPRAEGFSTPIAQSSRPPVRPFGRLRPPSSQQYNPQPCCASRAQHVFEAGSVQLRNHTDQYGCIAWPTSIAARICFVPVDKRVLVGAMVAC
ncbi:hypothetical protein IF1G_09134 [Cordyceps javanica]|uniref:Uncharacterized protein n=1 Tax=Cordyceps javanica TaxID=43265 RepID=A0A545URH0_9HYPO|nr:hypothetical protein IF1G_09134 [Cordyceps javanica]